MFYESQVETVEIDDTSNVTTMNAMFSDARKFNG